MDHSGQLERQARQLRERIESLDRYATAPYPEEIRRQVAAFAERARNAQPQWTWKKLSERLGVNHTSLSKWHDEYGGTAEREGAEQMVPVRIGADEQNQAVDSSDGLSVRVGEATIEGLSLSEAVEAARRLK
ncbi:MAG: hypothetical protein ABEL76_17070 [Bradymonadaceae bacterium]